MDCLKQIPEKDHLLKEKITKILDGDDNGWGVLFFHKYRMPVEGDTITVGELKAEFVDPNAAQPSRLKRLVSAWTAKTS